MDAKYRLTVEELQLFATQLETLPAKVEGREAVESLLQQVEKFQTEAHKLLQVFKLQESPPVIKYRYESSKQKIFPFN